MHKLLERQLVKVYGSVEGAPKEMESLIEAVSTAYEGFDRDRLLIERSLEISSRELSESEAKYRLIAETSADGIARLDRGGKILFVNKAWRDIFGFEGDEVLGKTIGSMAAEVGGETVGKLLKDVELGRTARGEILMNKNKNSTFLMSFSTAAVRGNNQVEGAILVIRDVTEQKNIENSLRDMALVPELNPAPVVRVDWDGKVNLANKETNKVFGRQSVVGVSWVEMCPGITLEELQGMIESGAIHRQEIEYNGKAFLFVYRGVADSRQAYVYGIDLTERKVAEKELLKKNADLEKLNKLMVDRELKMIELKKENKRLGLLVDNKNTSGNGNRSISQ